MPTSKALVNYRELFFACNGLGPYACDFCPDLVFAYTKSPVRDRLHVHHRNHNRADNTPENLGATHHGCHARHHQKGKKNPRAAEQMRNIQAKGAEAAHTPKANAKRRVSRAAWREANPELASKNDKKWQEAGNKANRGRKRTIEQRQRIKAGQQKARKEGRGRWL